MKNREKTKKFQNRKILNQKEKKCPLPYIEGIVRNVLNYMLLQCFYANA